MQAMRQEAEGSSCQPDLAFLKELLATELASLSDSCGVPGSPTNKLPTGAVPGLPVEAAKPAGAGTVPGRGS
eukprot:scaffold74445_cov40-Prasinocladus_malaysianus.AAC.5